MRHLKGICQAQAMTRSSRPLDYQVSNGLPQSFCAAVRLFTAILYFHTAVQLLQKESSPPLEGQ